MIDFLKPHVHEACIPSRQEQAQTGKRRGKEVAVHLKLRHGFWRAVRERQIVVLDMAERHQSRDRDRRHEQAQRERSDDQ